MPRPFVLFSLSLSLSFFLSFFSCEHREPQRSADRTPRGLSIRAFPNQLALSSTRIFDTNSRPSYVSFFYFFISFFSNPSSICLRLQLQRMMNRHSREYTSKQSETIDSYECVVLWSSDVLILSKRRIFYERQMNLYTTTEWRISVPKSPQGKQEYTYVVKLRITSRPLITGNRISTLTTTL